MHSIKAEEKKLQKSFVHLFHSQIHENDFLSEWVIIISVEIVAHAILTQNCVQAHTSNIPTVHVYMYDCHTHTHMLFTLSLYFEWTQLTTCLQTFDRTGAHYGENFLWFFFFFLICASLLMIKSDPFIISY